tara:strand:- start:8173 stop:8292 length:120 start_codon:yes stop_codon:yes gene_type:complete
MLALLICILPILGLVKEVCLVLAPSSFPLPKRTAKVLIY